MAAALPAAAQELPSAQADRPAESAAALSRNASAAGPKTFAASAPSSLALDYSASAFGGLRMTAKVSADWLDPSAAAKAKGTVGLVYHAGPSLTASVSAAHKVRLPPLQQILDVQHGDPLTTEIRDDYNATLTWLAAPNAAVVATVSSNRTGTFAPNDGVGPSFANMNSLTQGVEVSARVAVTPAVRLQASYTRRNTVAEGAGPRALAQPMSLARVETDIDIARNWTINARLSYDEGRWAHSGADPLRQGPLPGRAVADVRTTYTVPGRGAKIWLAGENVLGADDVTAAGYPMSESRVLVGATYGF